MWSGIVPIESLDEAGRWTVAFFSTQTRQLASHFPMVAISDIAEEKKTTVDPRALTDETINYLGLENVRSETGELTAFSPVPASKIKSRSKSYKTGDVLYGRLRPELNKVYLAEDSISPGICSNEFIVLRARPDKVRERFLRYLLASHYVSQFASKLRTGASLPRMSSADLLAIQVPLPPLDVQDRVCLNLDIIDARLRELREIVEWLPEAALTNFASTLEDGDDRIGSIAEQLIQRSQ